MKRSRERARDWVLHELDRQLQQRGQTAVEAKTNGPAPANPATRQQGFAKPRSQPDAEYPEVEFAGLLMQLHRVLGINKPLVRG